MPLLTYFYLVSGLDAKGLNAGYTYILKAADFVKKIELIKNESFSLNGLSLVFLMTVACKQNPQDKKVLEYSGFTSVKGLTLDQFLGAALGHEIGHTTKANNIIEANKQDDEKPAHDVSRRIIKETKQKDEQKLDYKKNLAFYLAWIGCFSMFSERTACRFERNHLCY